ncbi:TetR family transcriptional regulator [Nonomuraea rhodomycinica]|uniref:TetR family transcriptional regulator n=2 Tax=Nonomuraea rhodomycinica TaxID=1712872 RepID=A0A7Y6IKT3_9ACTN|nr:TetR family transcriptional regulator [Nonomuraea rhodomycinica]
MLFYERGFDNVTIGEIAEAADVSKVTVFNYFPRKEDIFFDRIPELVDLLTTTVREREAGQSVLEAIRRMLLRHVEAGHPLGGVDDRYMHFWRVVIASPALRARAREIIEEVEAVLAELIAESGEDLPAPLAAAMLVAAYRATYQETARRMLAGQSSAEVLDDYVAGVHAAFDALERAFATPA